MKVLIANGGFLPAKTYGGPVVSINNICRFLHNDIDFYIICSDHELGSSERLDGINDGWNDLGYCRIRYFQNSEINKHNLDEVVNDIKPDTIYINSLFDAAWTIPLLGIAKKKGIKVLLAPRGQLCKNAFIGKYKKIPYIMYLRIFGLIKRVHFQSTSDEETEAIKKYLKGSDDRIHFLTNLPSMPQTIITHPMKETGTANFVFFSRIVPKKNLINALQYFEKVEGIVSFDIFGPIEDEDYWEKCKQVIDGLPKNVSVNYKGLIDHDHVFDMLSQYDAFLFPTWSENFGHVISEALFSECPVIISNQTPWRGLEEAGAGWDIPLGDSDSFIVAIMKIVNNNNSEQSMQRINAKKYAESRFDLQGLREKYNLAFTNLDILHENYEAD